MNKNMMKKNIKSLLSKVSKEELVQLVVDLTGNNMELLNEVYMRYSKKDDELEVYLKVVNDYLNQELKTGYCVSSQVSKALTGVQKVFEKVEEMIERKDHFKASMLLLSILEPIILFSNYCDDEYGECSQAINQTIDYINFIFEEDTLQLSHNEVVQLYNFTLNLVNKNIWRDHLEFKIDLLSCFKVFEETNHQIFDYLEQWLREITDDGWNAKYLKEKIIILQYSLLLFQEDETINSLEFLYQNVNYPFIRELLIKRAIEQEIYKEAIDLAIDGIDKDKDLRGLVIKWKVYLYTAYEKTKDNENLKLIGKELLLQGYHEYYDKVKPLYKASDWEKEINIIIEAMKKTNNRKGYEFILVKENKLELLLEYCLEYEHRILDFYPFLIKSYFNETRTMFINVLNRDLNYANKRSHYKNICKFLQNYKKIFGIEDTDNIVSKIVSTFSKRKALLEELNSFKLISKININESKPSIDKPEEHEELEEPFQYVEHTLFDL